MSEVILEGGLRFDADPPPHYSQESLPDRERVYDAINALAKETCEKFYATPKWRWLQRQILESRYSALISARSTCLSVKEIWQKSLEHDMKLLPSFLDPSFGIIVYEDEES